MDLKIPTFVSVICQNIIKESKLHNRIIFPFLPVSPVCAKSRSNAIKVHFTPFFKVKKNKNILSFNQKKRRIKTLKGIVISRVNY